VRSQRVPERRPEPPAAAMVVPPAPSVAPPAAAAPEPNPVQVHIVSTTPQARATLRGRTHLLPFTQELKPGSEPEVVELTAPGREGRRFWITFDQAVTLASGLPEGRGVVEATEEETVIALGGKPVGGEAAAGDNSASIAHHRAGAHKRPAGKVTAAPGMGGAESSPSEAPAAPKSVSVTGVAESKPTPPAPAAKPEAPAPSAATSLQPAASAPKTHAAPAAVTSPPARPPVSGLDPAKTQAVVKSHLPEVQRCYERGKMDDPDIKGRITLKISVSATGAVTSAMVESSSLRSSAVESCVISAVQGWKFPAPTGGPAVISYPFNLR
jgi:TonB family protein